MELDSARMSLIQACPATDAGTGLPSDYAGLGKDHCKSCCTKLAAEQHFISLSRPASMETHTLHSPAAHASPMKNHFSKKTGSSVTNLCQLCFAAFGSPALVRCLGVASFAFLPLLVSASLG